MLTKLRKPALALVAGLVAGLSNQVTAATEEVVVYGTATPPPVHSGKAEARAEIEESMDALNEDLKATLGEALKILAPQLKIAVDETRTRG